MRLTVNVPVSSILCLPTFPHRGSTVRSSLSVAQVCSTPRGPYFSINAEILWIEVAFRFFFGIQVVEIAIKFVEAMHSR